MMVQSLVLDKAVLDLGTDLAFLFCWRPNDQLRLHVQCVKQFLKETLVKPPAYRPDPRVLHYQTAISLTGPHPWQNSSTRNLLRRQYGKQTFPWVGASLCATTKYWWETEGERKERLFWWQQLHVLNLGNIFTYCTSNSTNHKQHIYVKRYYKQPFYETGITNETILLLLLFHG